MKLETTKERILEAAAKCSTAKQTLQILFPEAFVLPQIECVQAGDVFKHPTGECNTFILVETRYSATYAEDKHYQLLGMGCAINSDKFHSEKSEYTEQEVTNYLKEKGMVFSHNIQNAIYKLHDKNLAERVAQMSL